MRQRIAAAAFILMAPLTGGVATAADLTGPRRADHAPGYAQSFHTGPTIGRQFYVRGDLGVGRYNLGSLSQSDLADNGGAFISSSLGDSTIAGVGIGVQIGPRMRFDLTGEYRASAALKGMDNLTVDLIDPAGTLQSNTIYQGHLQSYVGLANIYHDFTTWRGFTPYVGAGIGFAHHRVSGVTTVSSSTFTDAITGEAVTQLNTGTSRDAKTSKLAWALMVGTSYDLSAQAKLDIGYRYLNLGSGVSASSDLLDCACGTVGQPLRLGDLTSHDIRIGIRWSLHPDANGHMPLK